MNETNGSYGATLAKFSVTAFEDIRKEVADFAPKRAAAAGTTRVLHRSAPSDARRMASHAKSDAPSENGKIAGLPPGERAVLKAACQFQGVGRDQLSVLIGYKRSSRDAYIQRLREKGYVELSGANVIATPAGEAALGDDADPLPVGCDLQAYWHDRLPEGERKILDALIDVYPYGMPRSDLDEITGYKRSSRDAYIQRLKVRRLVETDGSAVCASAMLF